jgi:hypothetical protein
VNKNFPLIILGVAALGSLLIYLFFQMQLNLSPEIDLKTSSSSVNLFSLPEAQRNDMSVDEIKRELDNLELLDDPELDIE